MRHNEKEGGSSTKRGRRIQVAALASEFVLIAAAPRFFSENSLSGSLEKARLARIKKYSLRAL